MSRDRRLRYTFNDAATLYQSARPDYPDALYRDLLDITGITPPSQLLEIGCGSGKATLPLARMGFRITAVELGAQLAEAARHNLADFRDVAVVNSPFESWEPDDRRFELAYAATSWHWIDPQIRYAKLADLLEPGGHLATWGARHAFPTGFDPFFTEIQGVYDEIGHSFEGEWPPPAPDFWSDDAAEFESSGLFEAVGVRRYVWVRRYDADEYIALLNTFSDHIAMEPADRNHLYSEIRRRIAARPDERIIRHWGSVMTVGRRL